ncbi:MAG TPA: hypothetical protein VHR64_15660 [Thermomicrobiales bacterium]|nr:hypothetical protein [Thermomicrobiales bacterium]
MIDLLLKILELLFADICGANGAAVASEIVQDSIRRVGLTQDKQGRASRLQVIADLLAELVEIVARSGLEQLTHIASEGGAGGNPKHRNRKDQTRESSDQGTADGAVAHGMALAMVLDLSFLVLGHKGRIQDIEVARI